MLSSDQGASLEDAIQRYVRTGELRSFFNQIDDIEPYGPADRTGPGIDELAPDFTGTNVVDITIWPSGTHNEAERRAGIIQEIVAENDGQVLLRSVSARRSYLRIQITAAGLSDLLNTSVVELVRRPPVPFLDFRDWRNVDISSVSRGEQASEVIGVLDDSPESSHPLLTGLVLSDESLAPPAYQWQQRGTHGTEVIGRLLLPNLHEELRDALPITAAGHVRVVRILEPDPSRPDHPPRFAAYAAPHDLVEKAIRHLHGAYGVRVFNLSIGYSEPFNDLHLGPLTETIDDLARELNIVVVLPTGNVPADITARMPSGHHIINDKPEYFFAPEHRLAEPGPAALAVTVGALALSGAPAELPRRFGWQAAADAGEASPFSRSGPGLGTNSRRANKPDVTHFGGNVVVNDTGHMVPNDPGASLVSTSTRGAGGQIFAAVNGTSYAVPAVARVAADIAYAYPDASANLIRALLATGASQTPPAAAVTELHRRNRIYGLGLPDGERAVSSDDHRVTMTYDGTMPVDTVQIHPMPVPEEFRQGSRRDRIISVALAFDPPVRRQRREYLAGTMKFEVYRDISADELAEILERQDPDDPSDLISDRRKLNLQPGVNTFTHSTLQLRSWVGRNSFVNDDKTFLIAVTHKAQTWARNDPAYESQTYALAATLEDRDLATAHLHQSLRQQLRIPNRVRLRS
ncbi:S8 family serine peptidase [Mycolicibacter sp. MYC123]|uniref:S8 family serine peptidase n=1 Tax=[Mycobacterium] zoologicum TaxID=2872311 RepID=A0ABU5YMI2_9MYCO|nr:S8 family serine peptidase [Mycolicibacter sp. MYC123]MEB3051288.1 S8 family serine peptidase [Mycolicibacter sp. MYC123]